MCILWNAEPTKMRKRQNLNSLSVRIAAHSVFESGPKKLDTNRMRSVWLYRPKCPKTDCYHSDFGRFPKIEHPYYSSDFRCRKSYENQTKFFRLCPNTKRSWNCPKVDCLKSKHVWNVDIHCIHLLNSVILFFFSLV